MAEGARSKVQHIVADSAAFLKNAPLHDMCENVYTVEELISEIRDAATRQRLSVLPYTLHLRQPSTEALHAGKIPLVLHSCPHLQLSLCHCLFFGQRS